MGDQTALERLAALDSRTLPEGSFLLVEIGSELVAAAPIEVDAEPLKDPFRPTCASCSRCGQVTSAGIETLRCPARAAPRALRETA